VGPLYGHARSTAIAYVKIYRKEDLVVFVLKSMFVPF